MSRKFKFHQNLTRITDTLHQNQYTFLTLTCVIPVVCVSNEREESVVNQHN